MALLQIETSNTLVKLYFRNAPTCFIKFIYF